LKSIAYSDPAQKQPTHLPTQIGLP
jgi:hypothetical protein